MDIANLGVGIDPADAVKGGAVATKAAESMAVGMEKSGDRFEKAAKDAGKEAKNIGDATEQGTKKAEKAVNELANSNSFDKLRKASMGATGGLRNGLLDMLNATGLLNNPIGQMISRMDSLARATSGITGAAAGAGNSIVGMGAMMAGVVGIVAGLVAVLGALALGLNAIKEGVKNAAMFEGMENQLAILIGSFDGAKERMGDLRKLAVETPFELPGLVEANRLLETFTEGTYSSMDAMRVIGDAASAAGQPIKDVAFWVGRLYSGLKGGTPIGEATARLAEMAIITPKLKGEIDGLAESSNEGGSNFAKIWDKAEGSMKRFQGAMKIQSRSWDGLMSSISDSWREMTTQLGEPIMVALKPLLDETIQGISSLNAAAAAAGEAIGGRITGFLAMVQSGNFWEAWARNIWVTFVNLGLTALEQVTAGFATIGEYMLARATDFIEFLAIATTPEFWAQMGTSLSGIGIDFENALRAAAEGFINLIRDNSPGWLKGGDNTRADFGRLIKPQIPQPNLVAPDLANFNNGDTSVGTIYEKQLAGMKSLLGSTREAWNTWRDDYNKDKLQPIADKMAGDFAKNDSMLAKKGGAGSAEDEVVKAGKKAKDAATKAAKDTRSEFQKLMDGWGDVAKAMDHGATTVAQSISGNIGDAISDMITGASSAGEAFNRMAISIVTDLTKIATQMLVNWAIQKAIGFVIGAVGGGGAAVGTAAAGATTAAAVHHTGGTVGSGLNSRDVPVSTFRNAPRYQHGGTIPSGETPVLAEPGEQVLTRDQASDIKGRLAGGKSQPQPQQQMVSILNVIDPSLIEQHLAANPNMILNAIGSQPSKVKRLLGLK